MGPQRSCALGLIGGPEADRPRSVGGLGKRCADWDSGRGGEGRCGCGVMGRIAGLGAALLIRLGAVAGGLLTVLLGPVGLLAWLLRAVGLLGPGLLARVVGVGRLGSGGLGIVRHAGPFKASRLHRSPVAVPVLGRKARILCQSGNGCSKVESESVIGAERTAASNMSTQDPGFGQERRSEAWPNPAPPLTG